MKKLFVVSLFVFYIFISFLGIDYCTAEEQIAYSGGSHTLIYIENISDNAVYAIEKLELLTRENGIDIERRKIDYVNHELTIFTSNTNLYMDRLETGVFPSNKNEFVSTSDTQDKNQTGKLSNFNLDHTVNIYNFLSNDQNVNGEYSISITDVSAVEAFRQELMQIDSGKLFVVNTNQTVIENQNPSYAFMRHFEFIVLFLLLIASIWIYHLFHNTKLVIIRKMLGVSSLEIIYSEIFSLIICSVFAYFMSTVTLFGTLLIKGDFHMFHNLFMASLKWNILFTVMIMIFLFAFFSIQTISLKSTDYLKNKRHTGLITILSSVGKMAALLILFPVITSIPSMLSTVNAQASVKNQWDILKDYAILPVYEEKSNTVKDILVLGEKYRTLYKLENARGGILMNPSANLSFYYDGINFSDPEEPYFLVNNTVTVNNNYLKLNPIFDLNGERVDFPDEDEDIMTVLIPESYASYDNRFNKELIEYANFLYYVQEDFYLEEQGSEVLEHTDRKIRTVYVKSQQFYFSCDPDYAPHKNFYFKDPICIIANNVNMGSDFYLSIFSTGDFMAKVPHNTASLTYFEEHIKQSDLETSVLLINNAYSEAQEKIEKVINGLVRNIMISVLYAAVFLILCIVHSTLITDKAKRKIYIKRTLGYSNMRINFAFNFLTVMYYIVFALICKALGAEFTETQILVIWAYVFTELCVIYFNSRHKRYY